MKNNSLLCLLSVLTAQWLQGQCPGDERPADGSEDERGGRGLIVTKVTQLSSPVSACPFQGQRDTISYHLTSPHADCDSPSGEFNIFFFFDKNFSSQ